MKKIYSNFNTIFLILSFVFINSLKAQMITLGSGTASGATGAGGPINENYSSLHCQMVYTAAEITAAGAVAGPMTQFGFYIVSGVSTPLPNYTIKMKHTTAANVATYDGTGLSTVYTNAGYVPVAGGFDMLTLNTPFAWNGTDNILVDVCFDQIAQDDATGQVRTYTLANGFTFVRSDAAPQCGVACTNTNNKKPQARMYFPYPIDLGISAFVKPNVLKKCFGMDTIRVRVMNEGTLNFDFSTFPTVVTVKTTGPTVATYTLALNSGTIPGLSYIDTIVTTSFNMPLLGTYKLKGYTTFTGDANAANDTTRLSIIKKAFFSLSASPNDSLCRGIPLQLNTFVYPAEAGHDTIRNDQYSYPAPYGNYYQSAKHQFLFLASELTAAGVVPGNIQSVAFDAVALNNSAPLGSFNIAMTSTPLTALTQIETGLTSVYSTASYTPVLGLNTHSFTTPYLWNGTDNIIVETCFYNTSSNDTYNVSFNQSFLPFNASAWYNEDANSAVCSSSGAGASLSTERPNIFFGQTTLPPPTYAWSPSSVLTASNIANPVANINTEGMTVFTVTVNYAAQNCSSYDTLRVFIKQTPTLNLGHDTTVCTPNYLLDGGIHASTYQWNTGATTNTISVINTGTYIATATSSVGCVKKDTVHVTFNSLPIVTLGHDTAFCIGSYVELNAGNPSGAHVWGKIGGGFSAFTQTVDISSPGTYYAIVTSSLSTSCISKDTVVITTKTGPNVSLLFNAPPLLMCQFSSPRALNEGLPAGGTYIGPGVNGSSFDPALVGPGNYVIVYTYTGPNSCTSQSQDTLKVKACVGIEQYGETATLNIYPNPNKGAFTIAIDSDNNLDAALQILTVDGRIVYEDHLSAGAGLYEKQVDISGLADGIYYLKMQSANATKTYKILKQ